MRKLIFLIIWFFFVVLFCTLGVWQLHRYHTKKLLLSDYEHRLALVAKPFEDVLPVENLKQFQHVIVNGNYLNNETILLQNRYYHSQLGFEVITPFFIRKENKIVLIDRGWISHKMTLPELQTVSQTQLTGYIKYFNEYQFILGKNTLFPNELPVVSQKIDFHEIENRLGKSLYPFVIRIDADQVGAYQREWIITNVIPERHLGYAVQWFLMAIAVVIGCVCFTIKEYKKCKILA